ncbi:hypothetical protein BDA99DRAFT_516527 [Phascolomyces articulosus]|uniref:Uncharacterized protein n=1 Tax=Phascolomyces articulosus TaxID=60185 RepID=A0AAD5K614_9FUNG|nr:hypothetical protein BDA99DRAFT_516527 [Phascolomyces articulosus]
MSIVMDKLKKQIEMWRVGKYTKRRSYIPEYEPRDKDYYRHTYHDGVYLSSLSDRPVSSSSTSTKKNMKLFPLKKKSCRIPPPQCSETYNMAYHGRSY